MRTRNIILLVIIGLMVLSDFGTSSEYGEITCWYSVLDEIYSCSDGRLWLTEQQMINYYVPPLEQTEPDYTFVTGASTEGFN